MNETVTLEIKNVGQIKDASLTFGDLTVFVGRRQREEHRTAAPQAGGRRGTGPRRDGSVRIGLVR